MIGSYLLREQWCRGVNADLLLLACILVVSLLSPINCVTLQQDVNALKSLQSAWGGRPSSWDFSSDPCEALWLGVGCDNTQTRVTQLLLINQDLAGILPSSIGDLTSLSNLDLSSNPKLGGSLPIEITRLTSLQRLFLQFCNFSGEVPSDIGNLTSLVYLGLTQNSFSGPLPDTVGFLSDLFWLDVSSNQLTGLLPDSTTSSSGRGLDNLTNARHFHLENNSFSGSIPSSMFNTQMRLIHLLLHYNKFNGSIPISVGNLIHMEILRFDFNELNGSIPSSISSIQNLTTLQLNNNQLSGELPDLSNATNLQMLYVGNNSFTSFSIPSWITRLAKLYLLSMDSANLVGNVPAEIFSSSPNLSNVSLASNNLNGTFNLSSASSMLILVNLANNKISDIVDNNSTAQIILDGNPYCTTNESQCNFLRSTRSNLINATNALACSGSCPENYMINPNLLTSCQCFRPVTGNVDFLASKLPRLEDYNLTVMANQFASRLSQSAFMNITFLDFQVVVNSLTAKEATVSIFPPNNTDIWSPIDAAVISYGLKNQEITYQEIGPMVCAFIGTPYDAVIIVNGLSTGAKVGIAIASIAVSVAIVMIGLYAWRQRNRAEKAEIANKPFAAWMGASGANIPQLKGARWFSLEEIRMCTNNFSRNNEIGEGGYGKVYKGYLASGNKVAVKRAGSDSLQGAPEFRTEIELLSRVHHRNLVGLIGFCFEEGEQMLVYEFMPNGTLRECLSGTTGIHMSWDRRMLLALGSARGIAYLHNEANPPIIHRDIKSTNILLDDKLIAKVADFGLSKLAPTDDDSAAPLSTQVKGTLGYLDPDYFMNNRLTEKSDVYSFGVVLLEVVTGRLPIKSGKYVVREMRTALAEGGMAKVMKTMVDPELKEYPSEELRRFVELALACVEDSPDRRPTMAEVVKEIESLSELSCTKLDFEQQESKAQAQEEKEALMEQKNAHSPFDYSGGYTAFFADVTPK